MTRELEGVARALAVIPGGPVEGELDAPASKSVTNRALVLATLADGVSTLRRPLASDDSAAMLEAVSAFGARVERRRDAWRITGVAGRPAVPDAPVDARLSGTTLRFVTALATLAAGPVRITGAPPLLRRPVGPLVDALRALGANVDCAGDLPPVDTAGGGLRGGTTTVDAARSSQFASAVLLVAPYARSDVTVVCDGLGAAGYVDLTAETMARWSAAVTRTSPTSWVVRAGAPYRPQDLAVEYDASAAAHLYALAVATGGAVTVRNASATSRQPDAAIVDVLRDMGAAVVRSGEAVTVAGPATPAAVEVDLARTPDQVTTVAALAALAPGTTRITGVAVARTHESDRLQAIATELGKLGVAVEQRPDGLVVRGGGARGPARLATHDDHRLAMAFAAIGARVPGVVIGDAGCVAKTYPRFWEDARTLGLRWREVEG